MTTPDRAACLRLLTQVSAYLDGELPAPRCREIERHCRRCERCRAAIAELRHVTGLCRRIAATPLPGAVRRRARARVRALLGRRARGR
jgi:anti-sigma factor RsiW